MYPCAIPKEWLTEVEVAIEGIYLKNNFVEFFFTFIITILKMDLGILWETVTDCTPMLKARKLER